MSGLVMAPVLIVTYDRLEHLKKTITSLSNNIYAELTDLYIASDFQRSDAKAEIVRAIRSYLKGVDGFKSVTVFERERNLGVNENGGLAVQFIFDKFDRVILMEDDLVTAPGYLKFMNQAFERYGLHERVFSITGYRLPICIPSSYQYDAFFLARMNSWGCGITKVRYDSVLEISRQEYDEFVANKEQRRAFLRGGEDLLVLLKNVAYGVNHAWDVRCMYTQFMKNQYTVYPTQSLVQNIGCDGTGMHCVSTDRYDVPLSDKTTFRFPDEPMVDPMIVKADLEFHKASLKFHNVSTFNKLRMRIGKSRRAFKQLFG